MFDICRQLEKWSADPAKKPIYLATVTGIEGSAVRGAGATMGIAADDSLTGSVSGGCIESTVIEAVHRLRPQHTSQYMVFCPSDDPFMQGLSPCGGTVRVCIYPYSPEVGKAIDSRVTHGMDIFWGVCTSGPEKSIGTSFALTADDKLVVHVPQKDIHTGTDRKEIEHITQTCRAQALKLLDGKYITEEKELEYGLFVQHQLPIPHALVVGGSHIGDVLVRLLKDLKWRVTVIDPRDTFAPAERFDQADSLLHSWPREAFEQLGLLNTAQGPDGTAKAVNRSERQCKKVRCGVHTAVAAITHSEQIDDEAVKVGLDKGCFYIGVLGSRRTFADRIERLKADGYSEDQLSRIHGPIGLDIGAQSPEEIALAIAAQMVQDYRKGEYL